MDSHQDQKAADAAFFDDWSEWRDFGRRYDKRMGPISPQRRDRPTLGLKLYGPSARWPRGVFWLSLINNAHIVRLMRAIPGAINDRDVREDRRDACWLVPPESSRELRAALPQIKAIIVDWMAKHD